MNTQDAKTLYLSHDTAAGTKTHTAAFWTGYFLKTSFSDRQNIYMKSFPK